MGEFAIGLDHLRVSHFLPLGARRLGDDALVSHFWGCLNWEARLTTGVWKALSPLAIHLGHARVGM